VVGEKNLDEKQVRELFECMRISNKFDPRMKPFRIMRDRTMDELGVLLTSYEYKLFKSYCPNLARGIEEYFASLPRGGG